MEELFKKLKYVIEYHYVGKDLLRDKNEYFRGMADAYSFVLDLLQHQDFIEERYNLLIKED